MKSLLFYLLAIPTYRMTVDVGLNTAHVFTVVRGKVISFERYRCNGMQVHLPSVVKKRLTSVRYVNTTHS